MFALLLMSPYEAAAGDPALPVPDAARAVMAESCFGCHADGASEGGLSFDDLASGAYGVDSFAKWVSVWKNVRAETMPPAGESDITPHQRALLLKTIEADIFRLDPKRPDPGVVTIRRLNRAEYQNAISDILGVSYNVNEEFPADDTGYGFDTIGDVLNMSPVLFEKYLAAADEITSKVVPLDGPSLPEFGYWSDHWKTKADRNKLSFVEPSKLLLTKKTPKAGRYSIRIDYGIDAIWTGLPETVVLVLRQLREDGQSIELGRHIAGWESRKAPYLSCEADLPAGEFQLELELIPGHPRGKPLPADVDQDLHYELRLLKTTFTGPADAERQYKHPANRILTDGPPADDEASREAAARKVITEVADRAFRRPVDRPTVDRLVAVAKREWSRPGQRFEHGIKAALSLVISSPRFLFRIESTAGEENDAGLVLIDEFDLATRLAFFLWSSPPSGGLHWKARDGKLREELDTTIDEMLDEQWRRERFVRNFVGQWLQLRDIHEVDSNVAAVLGWQHPDRKTFERRRWNMREAMRRETEMLFEHLIAEDRPVDELLTARYTFANQWNALAYGLKGVEGDKMRRVNLPADSHRRGILTHGSVLLVTSNPTRTSPVKRGLFVLENLLGSPAPPAPPDVPALEETKSVDLTTASLRKILEAHRSSPECASCHQRMDPLGLALEHFDALGVYRDVERARPRYKKYPAIPEKPIDPSGVLLSGESFGSLDELIDILATKRKRDLYRCLTEKLMTYGLGRGIEYYDAPAIDAIVAAVEEESGSIRTMIREIIKSVPFQYRRGNGFGDRPTVVSSGH